MIIKQYIKDFENLGFGMFVHFGLYTLLGHAEWVMFGKKMTYEENRELMKEFNPDADWAKKIVRTAKKAGCKYITLTTRHHDGFSLYDTCGLNDYDAPHSACGRDIVKEFVEACNNEGIIPFFYHTLLDWSEETYKTDFKEYLKYLRKSVEIICSNYGKIGGIWFDGMWDKKEDDWEEDALYSTIRKYQPDAMIINNTGLSALGELGHIELDSVTFERGKPSPINLENSPKYIASEVCDALNTCWGYGKDDINYKSPSDIIEELAECRKNRSNFLLNVGPLPNGKLRLIDEAVFELVGQWMEYFGEAIGKPEPTNIRVEGNAKDFILKGDEKTYYLFCYDLITNADPNVVRMTDADYELKFDLNKKIKSVYFMDNNEELVFNQNNASVTVQTVPYIYGRNLVVRVAKIICDI